MSVPTTMNVSRDVSSAVTALSAGRDPDALEPGPVTADAHDSRATHPTVDADAELVARRALGAAMNRLTDGDRTPWIPAADPDLIERARALLLRRVPAGPELTTALELLDAAAPPPGVTLLP